MRTRIEKAGAASNRAGKKPVVFLCLLTAGILAGAVAFGGCAGGGTATSAAQVGQGTASGETQTDLASPAQDVLNVVYASVVNIAVTATVGGQSGTGIGSGIIYTSDGYIMTNDHVVTLDGQVSSGQQIVVTFSDGSQAPATIVGEDATKDLAAIKVNKTGLTPVTFSKSSDVKLAEWATVIGSPLDFRNSVTLGIVSGLDRSLQVSSTQTLTGLMQIDTPISPGNSGGGCFDTQGDFIGMPEVYLPPGSTGAENIGFAIPADVVAAAAKALTGK
ncbi:MAG: S1C family serine protease [Actinobacteria bacterium]|nr:S1C family serine protease [Actinomycetota bacterium]